MKKKIVKVNCCKNCIKGIHVGINNEILCREKGIVSGDFCCSGFMYFDLDSLQKQLKYHCSDCAYFTFTPTANNDYYGVCSMFSVRKCDGSLKKACSKFEKKKQRTA
ncbi:MAG: hypothetical protein GX045_04835 [Clostridiaceae bacterium]|jgi:hypothetical protein|nr:hypothetical protein [Clostridiaceae bacterium]